MASLRDAAPRAAFAALTLLLASAPARSDDQGVRIDALFAEIVRPDTPGGSVMVIHDGKVAYQKAYGMADLERRVPATTATTFRLASPTKQFTAMAIMLLAERGELRYDDTLAHFFPELPAYAQEITIRNLLQHQSGLPAYEDGVPPGTPAINTPPGLQLRDRDVLAFLKTQDRLLFASGTEYRYSNTGYVVLGMIIERISGVSFSEFLQRAIFNPLGMGATVAHVEGITTVANRAYGYSREGNKFLLTDQSATSATLGDGGVYSSVEDLFRWDQELYAHKLIGASAFERATIPGIFTNGKRSDYGFGWQIATYREWSTMQHSGSSMGFRTFILRIPEKRFTVIVLMNRSDTKPEDLAKKIADLYFAAP